ncbi:hypothetical protein NEIFLAOT_01235 [Neisseria flavescens NRL30031/H210]|uniref:Uncharacterized protein n=1 Tax=Neisseria flavescens NRL30031/H210 TaxID=546264 RepID=C0EMR1_NEIFL|nr:hypothetical protein NEIFLAOT_01235 [Neisseria flavescens NRL30031/H210]
MMAKIMRRASGAPKIRTVRSVARKNKRKTKRAPGRVETKNSDGELHQIVTGNDHQ